MEPRLGRSEQYPTDEEVVEELCRRRLAVSTAASDDVESARRALENEISHWGVGPELGAGDLVLIWFGKGLLQELDLEQEEGFYVLGILSGATRAAENRRAGRMRIALSSDIRASLPVPRGRFPAWSRTP